MHNKKIIAATLIVVSITTILLLVMFGVLPNPFLNKTQTSLQQEQKQDFLNSISDTKSDIMQLEKDQYEPGGSVLSSTQQQQVENLKKSFKP